MANEKRRLIDANALMDTVEGVNWYHIDKIGYLANGANSQMHTPLFKAEDIFKATENAPTVDAVEVVHGRWYLLDECSNAGVYCSVCHKKVYKESYANQKLKSKYCPNCGSRMDGDFVAY